MSLWKRALSSRTTTAFYSSTPTFQLLEPSESPPKTKRVIDLIFVGLPKTGCENHCRPKGGVYLNGEGMTKRIMRTGVLLALTFVYSSLFAQLLQIRSYSTGDGLPQSEVISVYQDRAGYLWLGTYENGLARYDGRAFQRIAAPNGVLDGAIRKIFQDRHGAMWIGTEEGLVRLAYDFAKNDTTFQVFTKDHGLPHNFVTSILEDSLGVLWVVTRGGACYWRDSVFVKKITERSANNNIVASMALARDGSLWMGTTEGVNIWRGDSMRTLTTENGLADNRVRAVLCDRDGVMWIGTRAGLTRISPRVSRTFDIRDGLSDVDITALAQDQQGQIWIGATSGVSRLNPPLAIEAASVTNHSARNGFAGTKIFSHFDSRHGLTGNRIAALLVDYENNLWLGTWGGGVCKIFGNYIENYSPQNGLPAAQVYCVLEDRRNRIWLGTNGGGLTIVDGDSLRLHNTRNGLPNNVVHALEREASGALWIGTEGGAVRMSSENLINTPQKWQIFSKASGFADDRINDVYCSPSGEVWLATNTAGAHCFADGRFTSLTTENGLPNNTVRAVHQDRRGRLWIATAEGLFSKHGGTQKVFRRHDAGLPVETVYCIFEDHRGSLWFGTRRGGVALYANEKFYVLNTDNGLSNNVIYFIIEDRRNRLWFGTNNGVDGFDAETLVQFLTRDDDPATPTPRKKIAPYFRLSAAHGMADNECNLHAAWRDHDDNLWFGTAGGATKLYPERLPLATPPPRVDIRPIKLGKRLHDPRHALQVQSKTSLTFHFRTLSFLNERNTRSQYFLEGLDGDWIGPTMDDHVRYANLSPGQYTFHLRGANAFGVTSKETAQLRFEIMPPFYRQWWFIISGLLVAGGLIYGGHRWRLRQVHKRNTELEVAVEEKTHNLQETYDFLANIKESLPVGLLVIDEKRFVVEGNRTGAELFGYSLKELLGQEIHNLLASETMTRDMLWAALREEMHARTSPSNGKPEMVVNQSAVELEALRHDGKKFPCRVHACSVENERGELRYVILTCEDISERRQLEQNLVENQKQLALLDLLAGMGDILNNKLAGIQGYLDLLKNALTMGVARREDSGQITSVNPVEVVNWAHGSAGEMNTILRQLIEFGTYIAKVQAAPLDLGDILHSLARRWNKILTVKLPEITPPLWVNAVPKIKAGLDEAIRNSREAEATEVVINLEKLKEQARIRLILTDNGRGISPELVSKVFLPFFKTKATSHPGLGLWKLRQLVQQSGGSVEFNFVPKGGTQLVVTLPMATPEQISKQIEEQPKVIDDYTA